MNDTINGRTPDEIKKGLECCINWGTGCIECPYNNLPPDECVVAMKSDNLALIQQLERERDEAMQERDGLSIMLTSAESTFKTMKRERDEAVKDLGMFAWGRCAICVHCDADKRYEPCLNCGCCEGDDDNWQWRGAEGVE